MRFLVWWFGEFSIDHQINNSPIELYARMPMVVLKLQIANLNFAKAKITHYDMVCHILCGRHSTRNFLDTRTVHPGVVKLVKY